MSTQQFSNSSGSFPVSTRTFDILQEDIHLALNTIAKMVGMQYAILKTPTAGNNYNDGLCIFNYEVMPLKGDLTNNNFIELVSTTETIAAN